MPATSTNSGWPKSTLVRILAGDGKRGSLVSHSNSSLATSFSIWGPNFIEVACDHPETQVFALRFTTEAK